MINKIRILIADDHMIERAGLTAIVNKQRDMKVVAEAAHGRQAVEFYREHVPDVALLDMRMPVMSGIEAASAIRASTTSWVNPTLNLLWTRKSANAGACGWPMSTM